MTNDDVAPMPCLAALGMLFRGLLCARTIELLAGHTDAEDVGVSAARLSVGRPKLPAEPRKERLLSSPALVPSAVFAMRRVTFLYLRDFVGKHRSHGHGVSELVAHDDALRRAADPMRDPGGAGAVTKGFAKPCISLRDWQAVQASAVRLGKRAEDDKRGGEEWVHHSTGGALACSPLSLKTNFQQCSACRPRWAR